MSKIRIILADDHKVVLDGLELVLSRYPHVEVVGVAQNGHQVMERLAEIKDVDVLVLDIQMPGMDGFETARQVKQRYPNVRILVLSMHNDKPFIERMYQEGASGYLLKTATTEEILNAIEQVNNGHLHFAPEVMMAVLERSAESAVANANPASGLLTRRERQVITLIAKEFSNQEIAERLELSVETINTYRKNMLKKLGVKNTAGLVRYAISEGLVED